MPSTTTLNENLRAPLDGTEYIRLATTGANWKVQVNQPGGGSTAWPFGTIAGGTGASSSLVLESTTGVGTTDSIIFKTGSQASRAEIDTSGTYFFDAGGTFSANSHCIIGAGGATGPNGITAQGTSASDSRLSLSAWAAATANCFPLLLGQTSRGNTVGTHGISATSDICLELSGYGDDGTNFQNAGALALTVAATPTSGHAPGSWSIFTSSATTINNEIMRWDQNQLITIPFGQINFPSSANLSSNVNTLDDYKEGTWTPSVGGTATYSLQEGKYTKIGGLVFFSMRMTLTALGTGSTTTVSGLPYSAVNDTPAAVGFFQNLASSVAMISATVQSGATTIIFTTINAAGGSSGNFNAAVIAGTTQLQVAGCYKNS